MSFQSVKMVEFQKLAEKGLKVFTLLYNTSNIIVTDCSSYPHLQTLFLQVFMC